MTNTEATQLSEASTALLTAATNLSKFHRQHEEFYASSPREQAVMLQRHGRTLQALADRWSTATADHRAPFNPYEGAEDLNADVALQLDGVLFMEGEGEPVEITRMKRDLRTVGEDSRATSAWLASAMEMSWEVGTALLEIPQLASVLGDRHRIIANDWHAAHLSALAGHALLRAAQILDVVDFSPGGLRSDLEDARWSVDRVYAAAELVAYAADLLSDSAGLVHDNEPRWRVFRSRVREVLEND